MRNWQKANMQITEAEFSLKFAADMGNCILKSDKPTQQRKNFPFMRKTQQVEQHTNPNELEVININHFQEEDMGAIAAFMEKYHALEEQIIIFDKAKTDLLSEVELERKFFINLYEIRQRFPIQDAFLLPEFKAKSQQVKTKLSGKRTLY